nr:MAG TPA_asm: hypothetical protein [Caudoviricetes sp.]
MMFKGKLVPFDFQDDIMSHLFSSGHYVLLMFKTKLFRIDFGSDNLSYPLIRTLCPFFN